MKDIELVIKIPEEIYQHYKKVWQKRRGSIPESCIAFGTPLPKGHGRIADMDEAIKCIEDVKGDDAIWAISLIEWACAKRTIIEADKAES